ncbi:MAG: hypothetical protein KJO82_16015 [Gammaproteobacteria bacterium]|nr:hypothetical protein [Gammaproteobacteria bacterium]
MRLTTGSSLLALLLWASQSGASTISYFGTATDTSAVLQDLFLTEQVDIHAEFEFAALPGIVSDDPEVVTDARVVIGAIPDIGVCYSITYAPCTATATSYSTLPLWVQSVESLAFDESGIPIAGVLTLTGLTRSPWPTDIVFDFSTNQWSYDIFVFASANGNFARVIPLPAALYLFSSALLWVGGIAARRRLRPSGSKF